jgi:hypothetical protein
MQQTASKRATAPRQAARDPGDPLVEELQSLFDRVHAATCAIDAAIAREPASSGVEAEADVVVLDDVTPRYLRASSALQACDVHLGGALQFLRNA